MTLEELKEKVTEIVNDQTENTLIDWWNEFQYDCSYDDQIYKMCELDNFIENMTPIQLIELGCDGFNPNDDYFYDNDIYGLNSIDDIYDIINISELVDYIVDNEETFGDCELEEVFEAYENEEI